MAVTQHHIYVQELEKLITEEIERIKDEMSSGLLRTFDDYKQYSGKIQGLRACLDYMEEASSSVKRKLGA